MHGNIPRAFPKIDLPSGKEQRTDDIIGLEGAHKLAGSYFFFECEVGQGNFLNFIRAGLAPQKHGRAPGNFHASRTRTQFRPVETHLMKRLNVFMQDDKILFLPKSEQDVMKNLQALQSDTRQRYHTQEIGVYQKIVSTLKPRSEAEERRLQSVLSFVE